MGLRIKTNIASVNAQRNLKVNSQGLEKSMERLASGMRINKSMDDVAGLAISETMQGQIKAIKQAERNASNGISYLQVGEGGLNETSNILTRMRELATQAASDTIGDRERGFLDQEVQHLKAELERISQTTEFSGTPLLNGSSTSLDFQVGIRSTENDRITFDSSSDATPGFLGVDGIAVDSKDNARSSLEQFDDAISKVGSLRATFGAIQSRLGITIANLDTYHENLSAANSRIRDADMGEEAANLAKTNVLMQASTSVLAQANMNNNLALKLL